MGRQYVFIAGGIGITPFRSMLMDLLKKKKKISIILFYFVHSADEILFKKELDEVKHRLGISIVYVISDVDPQKWHGEQGSLSEALLKKYIADYLSCIYYLAGPVAQVISYQTTLQQLGVDEEHIKTDSFSGYVQT